MSTPCTLFVGIGSPHGDDQAGWLVADGLKAKIDHHDVAVRKATTPSVLIDWLDDISRLIVCDACRGLGRAGEVRSWNWPACELSDVDWSGTHDCSLPAVLQMADRLGRLPRRVMIWTVEGALGDAMTNASPEVATAIPGLIAAIANEMNQDKRCMNAHSSWRS